MVTRVWGRLELEVGDGGLLRYVWGCSSWFNKAASDFVLTLLTL